MDPYNFNPYAQQGMPGQGLPMGRMGPQGMPGQGMPPQGMPQGMPGGGAGGGGAPFGQAGPGGPVGGVQAALQGGPQPTGPMPPTPGAMPPGGGSDLSPELVQKMLALRAGGSAITEAEKQQLLADQLRSDARGALNAKRLPSSTGGMVVAPTWGAALGSMADQYRAHKLDTQAGETRGKVDKAREDASKELFEAMRKRNSTLGAARTASEV